eukprot:5195124-Pleurochrysis_carterae.AAC.1
MLIPAAASAAVVGSRATLPGDNTFFVAARAHPRTATTNPRLGRVEACQCTPRRPRGGGE